MAAKERWQTQDEEDEHRRGLLARASKGDAKAQQELLQSYGARIYSEREKSRLVYENVKVTRSSSGKARTKKSSPK
jgi:hypothetical protein